MFVLDIVTAEAKGLEFYRLKSFDCTFGAGKTSLHKWMAKYSAKLTHE